MARKTIVVAAVLLALIVGIAPWARGQETGVLVVEDGTLAGQHVVRGGAHRPTPPTRRPGRCRLPPRIHARAGAVPHAADPLHAIRPPRGDRVGVLHRLDLRRAKGPPTSNWSTFA